MAQIAGVIVVPGAGPVSDRYVRPDWRDVWAETNGVPGLQVFAEWTCGEGTGQPDLEWIDLNPSL